MNQVKIYDRSGSLKKIISSKELKKRADELITNPMQYRKTNRKPSSVKSTSIVGVAPSPLLFCKSINAPAVNVAT